ncbi:XdhC family protein [Streptomyces abyssomicinicus]|uniref:XdhC family protein n=1 Tax=Streptomyces abyssomicinicus TaxID=574929 RepID=UPI00124FA460|nr:XdhC/CoxI family protein [Streptomyces abyssomicinicus]
MTDLLTPLRRWHEAGTDFAVALLVEARGSAPRRPGAAMAVGEDRTVAGSLSGGCVEGAVYEACLAVLEDGHPQVHEFGVGDEDAFAVGLTCGGTLRVLVRAYRGGTERAALLDVLEAADRGEAVALATVVDTATVLDAATVVDAAAFAGEGGDGAARRGGPAVVGAQLAAWPDGAVTHHGGDGAWRGAPELARAVAQDARALLAQGGDALRRYGALGERRREEVTVFTQSFTPPPRMLVFGAIDHAAATARMGAFLGYRVTVCDARPVFATPERFPMADEVVRAWPSEYLAATEVDARTVICVLTHDPRFDVPLLVEAVRTPAAYIGVMGSRRTHAERAARLREAGVDEAGMRRLASPIGLDLGAVTPEETAVSIAAEIVRARRGGTALPLSAVEGPIHRLPSIVG